MIDKLTVEHQFNFLEIIVVKEWKPNNKEGNEKIARQGMKNAQAGLKSNQARNEKCPGRE